MTAATIQEMLEKEPFEPFRICLSNGESVRVRNPGMVTLMKSRLFVANVEADTWFFVSYLHIAAVETIGNGHHRKAGGRKRKPRG